VIRRIVIHDCRGEISRRTYLEIIECDAKFDSSSPVSGLPELMYTLSYPFDTPEPVGDLVAE